MHNSSPTEPSATANTRGAGPGNPAQGCAHAKAILFGEHAVVYGAPALAVPLHGLGAQADIRLTPGRETRIDSQLFSGTAQAAPPQMGPVVAGLCAALEATGDETAEVQVGIRSAIPHSRGLGSSAAVATAIARAVADLRGKVLDRDALHAVVARAESVAHGRPSGIDAWAVATQVPIRFQSGRATGIDVGRRLIFVVADSGQQGSTAEAVTAVRELRAAQPKIVETAISHLSELTEHAVDDVRSGDLATLGSRMLDAHRLLSGIGVSSPALDALVEAALGAGAHGAKLTGGGLGGCVLGLADSDEQAERLALALRTAGAPRTWTTEVSTT
ncbi:mevalonate kinase [Brevibacterium sp. UCMA 11752]|uniref:mevalonate kinase n=1 Tax=Brevibacterium sp. UCMA 11752 TaxID=2745946 RepID=UPI001F2639A7|nr:mevalonate kinase [Brevibacterium sp. UCMA 11752]MCF2586354.1 mevalonate kinase [Brevibacterium sp. UCMA 11752]